MPQSEQPKLTIAAIDIGSNSAHMVIAAMDHAGDMRVLDSDKATLRLGQALDERGNLNAEALKRTIEALAHMQEIIKPYGATIRAVATHALREARNHHRLLADIERASGIKVELIDGIEEARLVYLGMRYGLALRDTQCLGVDIGGGSTEIIIARDDEIRFASSVKLGAVTLTDKYFQKTYNHERLQLLRDHVRSRLAPLQPEIRRHPFERVLASSGTAKALALLHTHFLAPGGPQTRAAAGINTSWNKDPNGYVISRDHLSHVLAEVTKLMTPQKIRDATGLDSSRAEILLAGAVILDELTRLLKIKEWVITSYGLREGLVADTFHRLQGSRLGEFDIQNHSVRQFARRLGVNEAHALQVSQLADRLYLQLTPLLRGQHGTAMAEAERKLVRAAAHLREAGKFLSAPQYHRHSQYLIANSRLPGFTEAERLLMGLMARFQRKGVPSANNPACANLSDAEIQRLRFLSGLLRLAAALDRTRQQRVNDVRIEVASAKNRSGASADGPEALNVVLIHEPDESPDVELHKARLEQGALEKSWGLKLHFATQAAKR